MFPGIFSTYFPRPFLSSLSAPITTGTVTIILLLVIILLHSSFYIDNHIYHTTKKPPGVLFISSTFERGREGDSTETGGAYLRGGLN